MRHPVHRLLEKWLNSDQFAFDSTQHELWPSERIPPLRYEKPDGAAEPPATRGIYGELEYRN
jgi:hypothetical protein